jgi:hypothetical protein
LKTRWPEIENANHTNLSCLPCSGERSNYREAGYKGLQSAENSYFSDAEALGVALGGDKSSIDEGMYTGNLVTSATIQVAMLVIPFVGEAGLAVDAANAASKIADVAELGTAVGDIAEGGEAAGALSSAADTGEVADEAAETVRLATEGSPAQATGESSSLLDQIREAGGKLQVAGPDVPLQDLAQASRAGGNEIALYQDMTSGNYFATEGGTMTVDVPANSNLILHVQPGDGPLSVIPSVLDRQALQALGQESSTIINSAGTYQMIFGINNVLDGPIESIL